MRRLLLLVARRHGAPKGSGERLAPKALAHFGPISGPIAGTAYAALRPIRERIRRVVLLGPSHRVPVRGLATSSAAFFRTPLGPLRLDLDDGSRREILAGAIYFPPER